MHLLTRSLAAILLATTAASVQAQSKTPPDFTGQWELNLAKSNFGGAPAPPAVTATVAQTATLFKLTQAVGPQSVTQDIPLGAKDSTWAAPDGQPVTSTSRWSGDTLVVDFKLQRQGMDVAQANRWLLSADRQTMTMLQQTTTPMGAMSVTLVFDRKR